MKQGISDLADDRYAGTRVLVRVDFNVSMTNGRIREDYRIRQALPTIEYLTQRGARVILASHLGKPKGTVVPALSLRPIAERLSQMVRNSTVTFVPDVVGPSVTKAVEALKPGAVLLLENLRFHPGEERNDPGLSQQLAALAEIYVCDAFGTVHRAHASTQGAAQLFTDRLAGFLVEKEMEALDQVRDHPARPFTVVVGGIKIKDKLSALKALIPKADVVLLGGGIAYTFLAAAEVPVGDSPVERDYVPWAREMLRRYREKLFLPKDHLVVGSVNGHEDVQHVQGAIPAGCKGCDIGRDTTLSYTHELLRECGTIFWNGPLGAFEHEACAEGTIDIARAMALAHWRGAFTVIGGGDTVAALHEAEVRETEVSHISTGGGASLQYIGEDVLPGIEVLTDKPRETVGTT